MADKNIGAWTAAGDSPAFISINRKGDTVQVLVREPKPDGAAFRAIVVEVVLSPDEFVALMRQINNRYFADVVTSIVGVTKDNVLDCLLGPSQ